jgi:hypothetical protein
MGSWNGALSVSAAGHVGEQADKVEEAEEMKESRPRWVGGGRRRGGKQTFASQPSVLASDIQLIIS